MLHPELLLEAGRQQHDERLRQAEDYRLALRVGAGSPRIPGWIRWGVADSMMSLGQRLRAERTPDRG